MRRAILAAVLLGACVAAGAQSQAVVRWVAGRVEVMEPGAGWSAAAVGMRLPLGATISTSFNSEATLEVGAATLQVRPLSRMRIDQLLEAEGTVSTELFLRVGRVRAEVKTVEGLRQDFTVRSPVSTAAVRGTAFGYDGVNLEVEEGLVSLANPFGQSTSVGGGEQGSSDGDAPPQGGQDKKEQQSTTDTSTGRTPPAPPPPLPGGIRVNWSFAEPEDPEPV